MSVGNTSKTHTTTRRTGRSSLFSALIGLTALAVLLQGLWAGIFLEHDGQRDAAANWIDIHARGGEVAIVLAIIATIVAFVRLRARRNLWVRSVILRELLIVQAYIGGLITDEGKDVLTAVHVPLAMVVLGLGGRLPLCSRRSR